MLHLYGVPVPADDARRLVATLIVEGTPAALSAAAMIEKGVERELYAVALNAGRAECLPVRVGGGADRRARRAS